MTQPQQFDDAGDFWAGVVAPDYQDFLQATDDLRRALHCAISLFHMADWVFHTHEEAVRTHFALPGARSGEVEFTDALEARHPNFGLIRGIANATKHLKLRNRRPVPHAPIDAANTFVTSTAYGEGDYSVGPYGGGPRVMLEGDGRKLEFADIARSVYGMWQTLKTQHGW